MHRSSKAAYGILAVALGVALTACGDDSGTASSTDRAATTKSEQPNASPSASASATWGPALALGQPGPMLYESSAGGKFEITVQKIVKGGPEQMPKLHPELFDKPADTPYFVFAKYTLKEGEPSQPNPKLTDVFAILNENGEEVAEQPAIRPVPDENGCPNEEIYLSWDIGETRTLCTAFVGNASKPPTRLVWNGVDARTPDEFKKLTSWQWSTQ
ncbi:hypothetical protein [Streptomyces sp.]|uniref:hypothetical protein n=1 Tax=Streptomyces sp. TaxID=1931 RepID=UPI002F94C184